MLKLVMDMALLGHRTSKHREKILNELSIIENQESAISSTLGEIEAVEHRVDDHAQKCQDDIDRAFEEMFANLQKYQQKMKADAAAYYNSLTGVFDQQKEQLRIVQSGIKEVVSSANATLEGDDQNLFVRNESISLDQVARRSSSSTSCSSRSASSSCAIQRML